MWPRCPGDPAFHHEHEDESPGLSSPCGCRPHWQAPSPFSNDVTASSKMFSKKNPVTKSLAAKSVVMLPRHPGFTAQKKATPDFRVSWFLVNPSASIKNTSCLTCKVTKAELPVHTTVLAGFPAALWPPLVLRCPRVWRGPTAPHTSSRRRGPGACPQGGCKPDPQLRPQVGLLRPAELLVDSRTWDLGSVCEGSRLVCLMSMSRCDVCCDAPVSFPKPVDGTSGAMWRRT